MGASRIGHEAVDRHWRQGPVRQHREIEVSRGPPMPPPQEGAAPHQAASPGRLTGWTKARRNRPYLPWRPHRIWHGGRRRCRRNY